MRFIQEFLRKPGIRPVIHANRVDKATRLKIGSDEARQPQTGVFFQSALGRHPARLKPQRGLRHTVAAAGPTLC
ncbi:MAG: hypothetical protein LBD47_05365 [Treponema sp.]|jgi:hypothetical protein|nr:hypothetical protein [Treponema sp.]